MAHNGWGHTPQCTVFNELGLRKQFGLGLGSYPDLEYNYDSNLDLDNNNDKT